MSILFHSVEDNDDLIPLFNRQSSNLKETYGEYFLAELIEAQDEAMQCLVAEVALCFEIRIKNCFKSGLFYIDIIHYECNVAIYKVYSKGKIYIYIYICMFCQFLFRSMVQLLGL